MEINIVLSIIIIVFCGLSVLLIVRREDCQPVKNNNKFIKVIRVLVKSFLSFIVLVVVCYSILFILASIDESSETPLMKASSEGFLSTVIELVEDGADVNAKNNRDKTVLMYAAENGGHFEIVRYLVENGAKISDIHKYSVNDLAWKEILEYGSIDIVKYLVENGANTNNTRLVDWAGVGWLNKVQECIKNGTDINAKNKWGWTALIKASEKGNLDIVEYLIKKEADVNAIDKNNYTALMYASENGYTDIVEFLKNAGAKE